MGDCRYRWVKQPNGNYTCKDYAIFATCERGKNKYDEDFLRRDAAISRSMEEVSGWKAPVHIRHTDDDGKPDDEMRTAKIARRRVRQIPVGSSYRLGTVVDLEDVDEKTKDLMESGKLGGRSVEIGYDPESKQRVIKSLALLGSTRPHHKLREGSEPEAPDAHFSEESPNGTQWVKFQDLDQDYEERQMGQDYGQNVGFGDDNENSQNGKSGTGQVPPMEKGQGGEGQIMAHLGQIITMLKQLIGAGAMGMGMGMGNPGMGMQGAAPQGMGMQRMQEQTAPEEPVDKLEENGKNSKTTEAEDGKVETESKPEGSVDQQAILKLHEERAKAEAAKARAELQQKTVEKDAEIAQFLDDKLAEGYAFDRQRELEAINQIGDFELWKEHVFSKFERAPTGQSINFKAAPVVVDKMKEPTSDEDKFADIPKKFRKDPSKLERAIAHRNDYDRNGGIGEGTREEYVAFAMTHNLPIDDE